jgi:hypothetical protein
MGNLKVACIEVVVCEHTAAHRAYENSVIDNSQVFHGFGDQLVKNTVTATGAIVRAVFLGSGLVLVYIREALWLSEYCLFHYFTSP